MRCQHGSDGQGRQEGRKAESAQDAQGSFKAETVCQGCELTERAREFRNRHGQSVTVIPIWERFALDRANRIAVIWLPESASDNTATLIGYYTTLALAQAAAIANETNGQRPKILMNELHADIPTNQFVGTVVAPEWYDPQHPDVWWQ